MKKTLMLIALATLAAGSACAQEGGSGQPPPPGDPAWNREGGGGPPWARIEKRGHRPDGPMSSEMMEQMGATHRAIKALGEAARLETDPAKKAVLVEQLRAKLREAADLMQAHQEQRLAQAEERFAGLKEKIEYSKANRDGMIEEQIQRILAGQPPRRPAAFDKFPQAKGGLPPDGPGDAEMPPPPPPLDDEDMPPPPPPAE